MAHGVHLTHDERKQLAEARTGVACCPLSNTFFAGGVFPLRRAQLEGLRVGFGTDVAGGYSPSLLVGGCRHSVYSSQWLSSRSTESGTDSYKVDYKIAFWT